jgi:hypothetical protein
MGTFSKYFIVSKTEFSGFDIINGVIAKKLYSEGENILLKNLHKSNTVIKLAYNSTDGYIMLCLILLSLHSLSVKKHKIRSLR